MTRLVLLGLLLGGLAMGQDPDPGEKQKDANRVKLVRDLTRLPAGKYEMVQSYEIETSETVERGGKAEPAKRSRTWNAFTFEVVLTAGETAKDAVATVTVRRVQIRMEGARVNEYDSDGPAAQQSEQIREQFRHLVGRTARVDLAAFGKGKGFAGLDEAWADYLKANPARSEWAEANRRNYGDGRLDRMFTQGLDILFGPDSGRADGRTRMLGQDEVLEVTLEKAGIGFEPTQLKHECRVRSIKDGSVVLAVSWKENGLRPTVDANGGVITRGADIKGSAAMTFRLDGGFLVGLTQTLRRTDQVGGLAGQVTMRTTERKEFTFRSK